MECGVAMFAGNWWAGLLTWVAFAVVVTARSPSPQRAVIRGRIPSRSPLR